MKPIFIFLLGAIACLSANAQTSLSGKVTDAKTGEALFAANVVLLKNGSIITGVETDFDGNFSITGLDPDTYDVRCTYTGMSEMLITGYPVKAGRANTLDIPMESNAAELGVVILTHTCRRIPLPTLKTALSGNVTDAKTGEALFAANVVILQNGSIIAGAETDFDGNYNISGLEEGLYSLRCTYTGMQEHYIASFPIKIDKLNRLDFQIENNTENERVFIPKCWGNMIDFDNMTSGKVWSGNEIRSMPIR